MDRIEELIAEYNQADAQQAARLQELFYILKARQGNRIIQFNGGDMLNNCWDLPDRLDSVTFLDKYNRQITSVEAGQA
jgi:hypothetical protein